MDWLQRNQEEILYALCGVVVSGIWLIADSHWSTALFAALAAGVFKAWYDNETQGEPDWNHFASIVAGGSLFTILVS